MDVMLKVLEDRNGKIHLRSLLAVRNNLAIVQEQKHYFTSREITDCFYLTNFMQNDVEIEFHSALLMETCCQSCYGPDNRMYYRVRDDMINNDILFTTSLLNTINHKVRGESFHVVQDLKRSIGTFLTLKAEEKRYTMEQQQQQQTSMSMPIPVPVPRKYSNSRDEYGGYFNGGNGNMNPNMMNSMHHRPMNGNGKSYYPPMNAYGMPMHSQMPLPNNHHHHHHHHMSQQQQQQQQQQNGHFYPIRKSIETCEPVVRFLAQVRKQGMDILFPQDTHDKILCAIFVAVQMTANPAHRELIDMVMAVKDSNMLSNMQAVSKTKIRGILALLKHGDVMNTSGVEGLPVNLFLADGVTTIQNLRERHDIYLTKFIQENHIHMPKDLWMEIVWRNEVEFRADRIARLSAMIQDLKAFYSARSTPCNPLSPVDSRLSTPHHEPSSSSFHEFDSSTSLFNSQDVHALKNSLAQFHLDDGSKMMNLSGNQQQQQQRVGITSPLFHEDNSRLGREYAATGRFDSLNDMNTILGNPLPQQLDSSSLFRQANVPSYDTSKSTSPEQQMFQSKAATRPSGLWNARDHSPVSTSSSSQQQQQQQSSTNHTSFFDNLIKDKRFVDTNTITQGRDSLFLDSLSSSLSSDISNPITLSDNGFTSLYMNGIQTTTTTARTSLTVNDIDGYNNFNVNSFAKMSLMDDMTSLLSDLHVNHADNGLDSLDMEGIFKSSEGYDHNEYYHESKSTSKRLNQLVDDVLSPSSYHG